MNDPLRDFVERNREEFDQLDAPQFNLDLFKKEVSVQEAAKPAVLWMRRWVAAAAVVLIAGAGFLILKTSSTNQLPLQASTKTKAPQAQAVPGLEDTVKESAIETMTHQAENVSLKHRRRASTEKLRVATNADQLADSSSASNRLAMLLEIDKSGYISEHMINRLAKTLESDGNSNVRLAALNVMGKYKYDAHVSALLVNSLNKQTDPLVQLELVRVLGTINNTKVDDKLYALVNDPNTLDAVKDEAYMALMKENKQ